MSLVAFAGLKTAGKDVAASILINEFGYTRVALADNVKKAAIALDPLVFVPHVGHLRLSRVIAARGMEGAKEIPEVRRTYQRLGTEVGRQMFGDSFWIDQLDQTIDDLWDSETRYVLTDARFTNEGHWVKGIGRYAGREDLFESPHGKLIWIERPGLVSDGHASESGELRDLADDVLWNDSTKEDFELLIDHYARNNL